ncbi:M15 family metallopeptidase [Ruminococcus albus]|uniref:D-alanyl-D-alanine carboxypeptidase n=1 Tax=Ruminococcus albus TaxID=1264 RepID=A0A1I1NKR8_RUMAL|nr:M15 family metallopeptidase [Ruminococcus albus]SFC94340.1 D-alanyl-D-alanine carboxypeptidase [Ruminococcus albus]
MDKFKMSAVSCVLALMLAGCGSFDERDTVNGSSVQAKDETKVPLIVVENRVQETEEMGEEVPAEETVPSQTEAPVLDSPMTESESSNAATIVLGGESPRSGQTLTQINIQEEEPYSNNQPVGNDVLPQSVDNVVNDYQYEQEPAETQTIETNENGEQVSANGYKIENINGVTYVGGILIANKSYNLPQNYGSGIVPEAQMAFNEMQAAAWNDGINLFIVSGYRSYWYQDQLYWGYVSTRGSQAEVDRFSARAGFSEHQTGLAMDLNSASRTFEGTAEALWIEQHCADYGFIIRYPDGKEDITGFIYEPWHIRYLGKDLARQVTDSGLCLEEFLGINSYYQQ